MTAHTEGPWATDGRESAWDVVAPDGTRIATVWRDEDNGPSDARLISAAPDLLAALERLEDVFPYSTTGSEERQALTVARAAIVKAKGKWNMINPRINPNGSSIDDLTIPRLKAVDHLLDVIVALSATVPHGRDYPDKIRAYEADRQKHYDRIQRLSAIREEIFAEALAIRKQGDK